MPPTLPKWLWYLQALLAIVRRILDMIDDDDALPISSKTSPSDQQRGVLSRMNHDLADEENVV